MKRTCETCTAWSQLIAEARFDAKADLHVVFAMCINPKGPKRGSMVAEGDGCAEYTTDPSMGDLPGGRK